jgi:hypothetical protein
MNLPSKDFLPPGPWHVQNGRVVDGYGRVIAMVSPSIRHPEVIAQYLAAVPEFLARPAQSELDELNKALAEADNEIGELEDRIDELENAME